ncbi:MAG: hypothetical protein HC888_12210 [Candidatus Competibacteraceae bacterium]|nr:hypothetical protein [Candidatus Competibacteraceae bacterium]
MTPYQTSTPPIPSNIASQQAGAPPDPSMAFMEQMNMSAMGPANGQGDTVGFAVQELANVATSLDKVSQIISLEFPQLMPLVKTMSGAGSQLLDNLMQITQGTMPQGSDGQNGSPIPTGGSGGQANIVS